AICQRILGLVLSLLVMVAKVTADQPAAPAYEWREIHLEAPCAPRAGAGLLSYQDKLWLLGGWNPSPAERQFFPRICNNEVWSSANRAERSLVQPNTFKVHSFDPASDWEGRHTAGYAVYRDRMWIIGG